MYIASYLNGKNMFGSLLSAAVKTVLLPVAVVKDVVDVVKMEEPIATAGTIESIVDDVDDAINDVLGG